MFVDRLYWTVFLARHVWGQARYPFRPLAAVRRDQGRHVRRIVRHAYLRVPYYRETMKRLGLSPDDFRTADDLAQLPLLERRSLQEDPEKFLACGTRLDHCLALSTSGSMGAPLTVYLDPRTAILAAAQAERYRAVLKRSLGRPGRYRETLIVPPASSHQKHTRFWLKRTYVFRRLVPPKQVLSLFDPPGHNLPLVLRFKPDILHSYGSYIEALFARLEAQGTSDPPARAVGFSADGLSESSREMIRARYGIPCFGAYSAVEATRIGFECEAHSGIHLNEDIYPLRIIDPRGRTLAPGENGEVVVSNLVNRAMVILNYRLGDTAELQPGPCPCGRSLPLLSYPAGRRDDWIRLPDGRTIHGHYLHMLLKSEREVLQYQVVQERDSGLRVSLVVRAAADRRALAKRLSDRLRNALGPDSRVELSFADRVPPAAGGKVRPVISLATPRGEGEG
jgi:phenylacetate-CoA ligase